MENGAEYISSESVNISYDPDMTIPTFYQVSAELENQAVPVSVHLADGAIPSVSGLSGERPDVLALATATILQGSYSDAPSYMLSQQQCAQLSQLGPVLESSLIAGQPTHEGIIEDHEGVIHNLTTDGLINEHTTHATAIQRQTNHDSRLVSHPHLLESSGLEGQTIDMHPHTSLHSSLVPLTTMQQVEAGMVFGNQHSSSNPIILMKPTTYSANSMVLFLNSSTANLPAEMQYSAPQVSEHFIEKKKRAAKSKPAKKKEVQHSVSEPVLAIPKPTPTLPPDGIISSEEVGGMEMTSNTIIALMKKKFNKKGLKINECPYCKKGLSSREALRTHLRTHTGEKPYQCEDCGKSFSDCSVFRRHQRIHTGEKPYICDICGRAFNQSTSLEAHKRTHTGSKKYTCEVCGFGFDKLQQLVDHCKVEQHGNTQTYKCPKCSVQVQDETTLKRHMCSHTGERAYTCHICGAKWEKQYGLMEHLRMHAGIKPYDCPHCNERFVRKGDLRVHMSRHVSGKFTPHKCPTCGEGFSQKAQLMVHERIHTGIKPYGCKACGKSFYSWKDLREHRRRHFGKRIYKCDICNKTFAAMNTLKVHVKMHMKNGAANCSVCLKTFHNTDEFVHHTRFEHVDKIQNADNSDSSDSDGAEAVHKPVKRKKKQVKNPNKTKVSRVSKMLKVKPPKCACSSDETSSEIRTEPFDDLSSTESSSSDGQSSDKLSNSPTNQSKTGNISIQNKDHSAIKQSRIKSIYNNKDVTNNIKRSIIQNKGDSTENVIIVKKLSQVKECNANQMELVNDGGFKVQNCLESAGSESPSASSVPSQGKVSGIENLVRASVLSDAVSVELQHNSLPSEALQPVFSGLNSAMDSRFQTGASHEHPACEVLTEPNDVPEVMKQTDALHEYPNRGILRRPSNVVLVTEHVKSGQVVSACGVLPGPDDVAMVTEQIDDVHAEHGILKEPANVERISMEHANSSRTQAANVERISVEHGNSSRTQAANVERISVEHGNSSRTQAANVERISVEHGNSSQTQAANVERISMEHANSSRTQAANVERISVEHGNSSQTQAANVERISVEHGNSSQTQAANVERISVEHANSSRTQAANVERISMEHANSSQTQAANVERISVEHANSSQTQAANVERISMDHANSSQTQAANVERISMEHANSSQTQPANVEGISMEHANSCQTQAANVERISMEHANSSQTQAANVERISMEHANVERISVEHANSSQTQAANVEGISVEHGNSSQTQAANVERISMEHANSSQTQAANVERISMEHANSCQTQAACSDVKESDNVDMVTEHTAVCVNDACVILRGSDSVSEEHSHSVAEHSEHSFLTAPEGVRVSTEQFPLITIAHSIPTVSIQDLHAVEPSSFQLLSSALLNSINSRDMDTKYKNQTAIDAQVSGILVLGHDRSESSVSEPNYERSTDNHEQRNTQEAPIIQVCEKDVQLEKQAKETNVQHEMVTSIPQAVDNVQDHNKMDSSDYNVSKAQEAAAHETRYHQVQFSQDQVPSDTNNNAGQSHVIHNQDNTYSVPVQSLTSEYDRTSKESQMTDDMKIIMQLHLSSNGEKDTVESQLLRGERIPTSQSYSSYNGHSDMTSQGKIISNCEQLPVSTQDGGYMSFDKYFTLSSDHPTRLENQYTSVSPSKDYSSNLSLCGLQFQQGYSSQTAHFDSSAENAKLYVGRGFSQTDYNVPQECSVYVDQPQLHALESHSIPTTVHYAVNLQTLINTSLAQEAVKVVKEKPQVRKTDRGYARKMYQSLECQYCGKGLSSVPALKNHEMIHTGERPYKCECGKSFIDSSTFKRHQRIHTGIKPYMCDVCGKQFNQSNSYRTHMTCHTGEKHYKCNVCGHSFDKLKNLMEHNQRENHGDVKKHTCNICNAIFRDVLSLHRHMCSHTGEKAFKCEYCDKSYEKQYQFNEHMRSHAGFKPFKCHICGDSFLRKGQLKFHVYKHQYGRQFECDVCHQAFYRSTDLQVHKRIHTGERPFKCNQCEKCFRQKWECKNHQQWDHSTEKPFTCQKCFKTFKKAYTLKLHMANKHENEKRHKCCVCKKRFRKLDNLKKHTKKHRSLNCHLCDKHFLTEKKTLQHMEKFHKNDKKVKKITKKKEKRKLECTECKKKFCFKYDLDEHRRLHTGENAFKCTVCSKIFSREYHLSIHIMKHTGEKRFKCDECGEPFASGKYLKNHRIEKHGASDGDIFKCRVCQREFSDRNTMKKHVKSHSSEKPYECLVCKRRYQYSWNLKIHEKSMHTGDMPFQCKFCEKKFTHKRDYRDHVKSHTDDLPFKCSHQKCGRSFASQRALRMHQPIHLGGRCTTPGVVSLPHLSNSDSLIHHQHTDLSNNKNISCGLISPLSDTPCNLSSGSPGTCTNRIVSDISMQNYEHANPNIGNKTIQNLNIQTSSDANAHNMMKNDYAVKTQMESANLIHLNKDDQQEVRIQMEASSQPLTIHPAAVDTVKVVQPAEFTGSLQYHVLQNSTSATKHETVRCMNCVQEMDVPPGTKHETVRCMNCVQEMDVPPGTKHETVRCVNCVQEMDVPPGRKNDEHVIHVSTGADPQLSDGHQLDVAKYKLITSQCVGRNDNDHVSDKSYIEIATSLEDGQTDGIHHNQEERNRSIQIPVLQTVREHVGHNFITSDTLTSVIASPTVGSTLYSGALSQTGYLSKAVVDYHIQPTQSLFTEHASTHSTVFTGHPLNYSLPVYKDVSQESIQTAYREHIQLIHSHDKTGGYDSAQSVHSQCSDSQWNTASEMPSTYNSHYDVVDGSDARFHSALSAQDADCSFEQSGYQLGSDRVEPFPAMSMSKTAKASSIDLSGSATLIDPGIHKYRYLEEIGAQKSNGKPTVDDLVTMSDSSENYLQSQIPSLIASSADNQKLLTEVCSLTSNTKTLALSNECSYPPVSVFSSLENKISENQVILHTSCESCKPTKKCKFFKQHNLAGRHFVSRNSVQPLYTTWAINSGMVDYINDKYKDLEHGSSTDTGKHLQELLPVASSKAPIISVERQDNDYKTPEPTNFQLEAVPKETSSNEHNENLHSEVNVVPCVDMLGSAVSQLADEDAHTLVPTQEQCVSEYFSYNWSKPVTSVAGESFTSETQNS